MHKAITLSDTIPDISRVILDYIRPEDQIYAAAKPALNRVLAMIKFKKNEIKKAGERKVFWKQLFDNEAQQQ